MDRTAGSPQLLVPHTKAQDHQRTRVLVVEDHPVVRSGLVALINATSDLEVCAEAANDGEALAHFARLQPDLVSLDLILDGIDAFPLIGRMKSIDPNARILVVSMLDENSTAEKCIKAGALGYVMKSETNHRLLTAMRKVAGGGIHLSSRLSMAVISRAAADSPSATAVSATLSARESEVFQLIGKGHSTKEIASLLGIGVKTVESHRENIKNKLRVEHSTALMREATRWLSQQSPAP